MNIIKWIVMNTDLIEMLAVSIICRSQEKL